MDKPNTITRARKPRPKPDRRVFLVEAPYADGRPGTLSLTVGKQSELYELATIPDAAWGHAFCLRKQDGTEYAVNLGDPARGIEPTCECLGHLRWHGTANSAGRECKHLAGLRALVERGLL
jgi:hypothetical protein